MLTIVSMPQNPYIGRNNAKIDKGGRVYIPSLFRKAMEGVTHFVARIDPEDKYLMVFTETGWNSMMADILSHANPLDPDDADLIMQINDEALFLDIDEQGRFQIPKKLAEHLEFKGEVTFVSIEDHFGIWGKERYDNRRASRASLMDSVAAFNKKHNINQ